MYFLNTILEIANWEASFSAVTTESRRKRKIFINCRIFGNISAVHSSKLSMSLWVIHRALFLISMKLNSVFHFAVNAKNLYKNGNVCVSNRISGSYSTRKVVMRHQPLVTQGVLHLSKNEKCYPITNYLELSANFKLLRWKMNPWKCQKVSRCWMGIFF